MSSLPCDPLSDDLHLNRPRTCMKEKSKMVRLYLEMFLEEGSGSNRGPQASVCEVLSVCSLGL